MGIYRSGDVVLVSILQLDLTVSISFQNGISVGFYDKVPKHINDLLDSKFKHHMKGVFMSKGLYRSIFDDHVWNQHSSLSVS